MTPAVVQEAIKTGVQATDRKPSAMKAELLAKIDARVRARGEKGCVGLRGYHEPHRALVARVRRKVNAVKPIQAEAMLERRGKRDD